MVTETASATDALLIVRDDSAGEQDEHSAPAEDSEEPEKRETQAIMWNGAPFDIDAASKGEVLAYARSIHKLELDPTRRLDFLRNQVKRAVAGVAPDQAAIHKPTQAPRFLRNRNTGRVFVATELLIKYGEDLDPCDAEGNLL